MAELLADLWDGWHLVLPLECLWSRLDAFPILAHATSSISRSIACCLLHIQASPLFKRPTVLEHHWAWAWLQLKVERPVLDADVHRLVLAMRSWEIPSVEASTCLHFLNAIVWPFLLFFELAFQLIVQVPLRYLLVVGLPLVCSQVAANAFLF